MVLWKVDAMLIRVLTCLCATLFATATLAACSGILVAAITAIVFYSSNARSSRNEPTVARGITISMEPESSQHANEELAREISSLLDQIDQQKHAIHTLQNDHDQHLLTIYRARATADLRVPDVFFAPRTTDNQ